MPAKKSTTVTKRSAPAGKKTDGPAPRSRAKVKVDGRGQLDRKPISEREANKRIGLRPAKVNRTQLERIIDKHIVEQHCSLYSKAFYVATERDRQEAIEFLANFFEDVNARLG